MDMKKTKVALVTASLLAILSGCNDNNSSSTDTPSEGPVARLPSVEAPGELLEAATDGSEVVIQLVDPQGGAARAATGPYADYSLHLWNNDACSDIDETKVASFNDWGNKANLPAQSDEHGVAWKVPLKKAENCINFIARNGDLTGQTPDMKVITTDDRTIAIVWGKNEIFPDRASAFEAAFGVAGASAHLIDGNTLIWDGGGDHPWVRLYATSEGKVEANENGEFVFPFINLSKTELSDEQKAKYPHLKDRKAFKLPAGKDLKPLLKGELVAMAVNDDGLLQGATLVQSAGLLDDLYAEEAAKLSYGAVVEGGKVTFRLWAPTATKVELAIYDENKAAVEKRAMAFDDASGSWSVAGESDLVGKYYRYAMEVYHPLTRQIEKYEVTDPYALSLAMNSEYSQVVDLNDASLKPDGWDELESPHSQKSSADLAKMVIYEAHIRDLTGNDESTDADKRGKFVGLTETDSAPVNHLKELAKSGVSHLHLLPVFDIATVNEDPAKVANISDPFSKLCEVNPAVKDVAKYAANCNSSDTIAEVLENLDPRSEEVQDLHSYIRGHDSFNWGYDPFHYTVPEGSYATDADGTARIKEFREMVMAIKNDIGMNVVMDVVYNHTNEAGLGNKSVLDKIVPWYYQRLNQDTGNVETSTCCSNTAPEHAMFAKLIEDSLVTWARDYKIDAFRFDLMGHHPKDQMVKALAAVKAVNPEMYFYGEGWNFGEVENDKRFVQATQKNLGGTGIGSFSDRLRDAVRGGSPFDGGDGIRETQGFGNGAIVEPNEMSKVELDTALHQADLIRLGMAGNLKEFVLTDKDGVPKKGMDVDYSGQAAGYAVDPIEIQNYVSKHDNQTLFDINVYKAAEGADLMRMQAVSLATAMLGQAIPFTHAGSELLRSKSMERDSYDSGDWYNKLDYTLQDNNYDKGLPRADKDRDNYELIAKVLPMHAKPTPEQMATMVGFYQELAKLRASSPLFTLGSGSEVIKRVDFRNTGPEQIPGLIAMTIDDGTKAGTDLDTNSDGLVVVINATNERQSIGGFVDGDDQPIDLSTLVPVQTTELAGNPTVTDGELALDGWSVAVFSKPQTGAQGSGLPVGKKVDLSTVPPFGDTDVFVRGFLGQWDAVNQMSFTTNFMYEFSVEVTEEQLASTSLKIAGSDWNGPINYGKCADSDKLEVGKVSTLCFNTSDLPFEVSKAGTYKFVFTAMDKDKPTLSVSYTEPVQSCKVLDTMEGNPLGYPLYVRGSLSEWNAQPQYQLSYKGMDGDLAIYQAAFNYAGSFEFKFADDSSNWAKQYFVKDAAGKLIALQPEQSYPLQHGDGGMGNNSITLEQGYWSFLIKVDPTKPAGGEVGSLIVQECSAK